MSFDNTQLTSATGYDLKNLRFRKAVDGSIPNSTVVFKRIPIGTRNPDGSYGDLVIPTPRVFSFGLSANTNMNTGKTDGYTLSLCLFNKDAPTEEEKAWVETFNRIVENIKEYILTNRDQIEKYELEAGDLKKLNPLYYKKEKGKIVDGAGPILYPKVLQNKKTDTITSYFYDESGKDIDPMTLLEGKRGWAKAAIKIESIFIGAKISLQIKVTEAQYKILDAAPKRLLQKMESNEKVVYDAPVSEKVEDDNDSIKGDDDDEEEKEDKVVLPPPEPVKAAPRRIGRKA